METKTPAVTRDRLSQLILSSSDAPLKWASQQEMVDLFMEFIEKQSLRHKKHVEDLEQIIKDQNLAFSKMTNYLRGCDSGDCNPRRC